MTIFFTECVYLRRAINQLLARRSAERSNITVVMDTRFFSSLDHMLHICHLLLNFTSPVKVIVVLNDKPFSASRELFPCALHVQDGLARWKSGLRKIMRTDSSLEETIACLTRLTGKKALNHKHRITMDFIRQGFSVPCMARIMNLSPKTVYGYINVLKLHFNQPRLCNLYHFIKKNDRLRAPAKPLLSR